MMYLSPARSPSDEDSGRYLNTHHDCTFKYLKQGLAAVPPYT
jgi:hypothetical protein